jgi:hypothetical protein
MTVELEKVMKIILPDAKEEIDAFLVSVKKNPINVILPALMRANMASSIFQKCSSTQFIKQIALLGNKDVIETTYNAFKAVILMIANDDSNLMNILKRDKNILPFLKMFEDIKQSCNSENINYLKEVVNLLDILGTHLYKIWDESKFENKNDGFIHKILLDITNDLIPQVKKLLKNKSHELPKQKTLKKTKKSPLYRQRRSTTNRRDSNE